MTGMFAFSLAGHDKGKLYFIWKEDSEYVYLTDGNIRPIERPKKKRKKHIQIVKSGLDKALADKLLNGQKIYDEEIKRAIKIRMNEEVANVKS